MRSTSSTYKQIIASGETRNWKVNINMTLADDTQLTLTEENIMQGSFKIMTASSSDSTFDLGSAIIGKCSFTLDNWTDSFTDYDFFDATAVVWVKLVGDVEYHRIGFFTVDEPTYAGSLVQIEMLDNMWKLDRPFSEITLPTRRTCLNVVQAICSYCGVLLATQNFHGYDFVLTIPEQEMNCREVLQYIAMIGCNFCFMDDQGRLNLKWYDIADYEQSLDGGTFNTTTTPYSDGDDADGGNFTNYASGDDYDGGSFIGSSDVVYFTRLMSRNIGTDVLTITGVKFVIGENTYRIGQEGYVLTLENPFVNENNVTTVLNLIWDILQGFKIRTFNITALPDITPEVGDSVAISYKGNMVYSYLTNFTFTPSLCTASLGAETPTRNLTTRYSQAVQSAIEVARRETAQQISDYDLAVQEMNNLAIHAMGAYQDYEEIPTGGRIYYLSNKPITKDSDGHCHFETGSSVFKTTGDGLFVSTDGGQTWVNGYNTQTGELIVNVLYTIGLHADWIYTGTLTVGGSNVRTTNPEIVVKDSQNNVICTINSDGIIMGKGYIASSDYQDTTPVSPYSQAGMKIDVNNKYVKSPYFGFDETGSHLKGEIEAASGKIGAATITQDSIKILGDIELYKGTSTFKFVPTDYYFAEDFVLSLEAVDYQSGSATVTLVKHTNGTDTTVGTYTINSTDPVETALIDHTVGQNSGDYYQVTISGFAVSVNAHDVLLAYMGQEGFRGILQGMFKGHIESKSGTIHGNDYDGDGLYGDLAIRRTNGYNNAPAKIDIDTGSTNTLPDIVRTYSGGSQSVAWGDKQNFIPVDVNTPPQFQGKEGDLVFSVTNNPRILYRYENGAWVRVNFFGGSGGYAKVPLYDGGSPTAYAQYNTTIQLLDNVSNYDMLLILTSTAGDGGLSSFAVQYLVDTQEALLYTVCWQGYKERYWLADFSNDTYFTYTGNAPNETNRLPYIYKIFGIKY